MASLQTKLCMLFDICQVFVTSIKERNGLSNYSDYCNVRLKQQLLPVVTRLNDILNHTPIKSNDYDFWALYQKFYQLWIEFFKDYQQRWNVQIIDNDNTEWLLLYSNLKSVVTSAHYLSHRIKD